MHTCTYSNPRRRFSSSRRVPTCRRRGRRSLLAPGHPREGVVRPGSRDRARAGGGLETRGTTVSVAESRATTQVEVLGPAEVPVPLDVNGRVRVVELEPRVSLLDALREHLDLTGSKKGCDQGTC